MVAEIREHFQPVIFGQGQQVVHNIPNKRLSADPAHRGSVQGLSGWHVLFISVGSLLRGAG
jgi:hypothetical protein